MEDRETKDTKDVTFHVLGEVGQGPGLRKCNNCTVSFFLTRRTKVVLVATEVLSSWIFWCNSDDHAQGPCGINEIFYSSNTATEKKRKEPISTYYLLNFKLNPTIHIWNLLPVFPGSLCLFSVWFSISYPLFRDTYLLINLVDTYRMYFLCWAERVKTHLFSALAELIVSSSSWDPMIF